MSGSVHWNRRIIGLFLTIATLCYAEVSLADLFSLRDDNTSNSDMAVYYLGLIFGTVGNVLLGTGGQVFGDIFGIFNMVILSLGVIVGAYTIVMGAVNTAQEGQVMGQKWSSVWIPIKAAMGMALLVPTASGYSLLQVAIMWLVLEGVYGANRIWGAILDMAKMGISITGLPSGGGEPPTALEQVPDSKAVISLVDNLTKAQMCKHALIKAKEKGADLGTLNPEEIEPYIYISDTSTTAKVFSRYTTDANGVKTIEQKDVSIPDVMAIRIGINKKDSPYSTICGQSGPIDLAVAKSKEYSMRQLNGIMVALESVDPIADQIVNTNPRKPSQEEVKKKCGGDMLCLVMESAKLMQATYENPDADYQMRAYQGYDGATSMNKLTIPVGKIVVDTSAIVPIIKKTGEKEPVDPKMYDGGDAGKVYDLARKNGWIMTGSYYYKLVHPPKPPGLIDPPTAVFSGTDELKSAVELVQSAQLKPSIDTKVFSTTRKEISELIPPKDNSYMDRLSLYKLSVQMAKAFPRTMNIGGVAFEGDGAKIMEALSKPLKELAKTIINRMTAPGDPMVMMAALGSDLIISAEIIWLGLTAAIIILQGVAAVGAAANSAGYAIDVAVTILSFPITIVFSLLWGFGASLAIYLPLIPYTVFLMGSISWLMAVIEAMVAAPLIALGITAPSAEHLGKAAPALMLLASVFLRPSLMVIGFLAASRIFSVVFTILRFSFNETLASSVGGLGLFGPIAIVALFGTIAIGLTNKCFSLIHVIPDRVLRWVGGQAEQWGQSDSADLKGQQEKFDKHSEASGKTASGLASGLAGTTKATVGHHQDKKKRTDDAQANAAAEKTNTERDAKVEKLLASSSGNSGASGPSAGGSAAGGSAASGSAAGGSAASGPAAGGAGSSSPPTPPATP